MPLSDDTIAHVAATLAAGIISQRPNNETADGTARDAIQLFNTIQRKLRAQHGDPAAQVVGAKTHAA